MKIRKGDRILFIGDSVTDVKRDREDPFHLGFGYPMLIAAYLAEHYPDYQIELLNRGISGNKIAQMAKRWRTDCLDLKPDIVSILIGINDVWHFMDDEKQLDKRKLEQFEADYYKILETTIQNLDAQIVLMEPFVLPYPKDRWTWRRHLDPRIHIIRRLAAEFKTELIPLDGILNAKGILYGYQSYTGQDGVHPTLTGHAAIAQAWIEQMKFE